MKLAIEKEFIRAGRHRERMYENEKIALYPREYCARVSSLNDCVSMIFDIVCLENHKIAGELALRIGDGPGLFYLGHIGYHVDKPYQGRHFALQACRLSLPVFQAFTMDSFVITTDEDNAPSAHTCDRLGCTLESTVDVPSWCVEEYQISRRKRRYVYQFSPSI